MDIGESINIRKSIRAFKPDSVPKTILEKIMEKALRAPSWGNTQPWDFFIVADSKLEDLKREFDGQAGQESKPDIARPQEFPEPYATRRSSNSARPAATQEIKPANATTITRNPRFYGAPCVIYICTGRSFYFQPKGINSWPIYDCGLISENIMLLAPSYGLGTIALAQAMTYPEVIRKALGIPDSLVVVLGIAIGYPDLDKPVNKWQSPREPMNKVVKWYGFE
jgi:nitroreductase